MWHYGFIFWNIICKYEMDVNIDIKGCNRFHNLYTHTRRTYYRLSIADPRFYMEYLWRFKLTWKQHATLCTNFEIICAKHVYHQRYLILHFYILEIETHTRDMILLTILVVKVIIYQETWCLYELCLVKMGSRVVIVVFWVIPSPFKWLSSS